MNQSEDDRIHLQRAREGDREAINDLVLRCYTYLWQSVRIRVDTDDEAQEIVQAKITKLFEPPVLSQFKPDGLASLKTWLWKVGANAACDWFRRSARAPLSLNGKNEIDIHVDENANDFDQMDHAQRAELIRKIIDSHLSTALRVVFVARFEGKSCAEVAELLGISESTVKRRTAQAVKLLKQRMNQP